MIYCILQNRVCNFTSTVEKVRGAIKKVAAVFVTFTGDISKLQALSYKLHLGKHL